MRLSWCYVEKSLGETAGLGCSAPVCLEFSLTQVFPVKGGPAQETSEASHIPKAQVHSLTRQRMDTMGCIPAKNTQIQTVFHRARRSCHVNRELRRQ